MKSINTSDGLYILTNEGIFKHIDREKVPKERLEDEKYSKNLSFYTGNYLLSSLDDETKGEWFEFVADIVNFRIKGYEDIQSLKTSNNTLEEGVKFLEKTLERKAFFIGTPTPFITYNIRFILEDLNINDFETLKHPLEDKSYFREIANYYFSECKTSIEVGIKFYEENLHDFVRAVKTLRNKQINNKGITLEEFYSLNIDEVEWIIDLNSNLSDLF